VRIPTTRLAALGAALLLPAAAPAHVDAGELLDPAELATVDGGRHGISARDRINVLVFVRAGQERTLDTLQRLAECEKQFAGKPVHVAVVMPGSTPLVEARALVATTGITSPVLLDEGDQVYGKLELRQHPMIVITDRKGRILYFEPYQRLRYCEIVKARIRYLLNEIDKATVEAIVRPPKAEFPNEVGGGAASRYVRLGDKELAKGNCALAVKAYDNALRHEPQNAKALEGRKRCGVTGPPPPAMKAAVPPAPEGDPAPQPPPVK
jgi:hypothetical protein